jgi:ribose transport system substrate-binding protein
VPVFTFDVQMEDAEVAELVTFHVGSDNYQGGRLAGESMMRVTGNKGKIGIVNKPNSNSCILRVKGFKDYLQENGSELEIVSELNGNGQRELGYTVTSDMLQRNGDIVGIFAINDPCGLGAYRAVEKEKKTGQVTIVGFDGSPDGKVGVFEKKLYDTPQQFPRKMAEITVETFLKHVQGEGFEKAVIIPCTHYYYEDAVKDENRDKF